MEGHVSEEWYIFADEKQTGPYTTQDLSEFLRTGSVAKDALVWRDGMPDWVAISEAFEKAPTPKTKGMSPVPPKRGSNLAPVTAAVAASAPTDSPTSANSRDASGSLGIAALIIGIVALINGCIPYCGAWAIIPALVGLVLGCVATVQRVKTKKPRAIAIAGLVLNALAVVAVCVLAVVTTRAEEGSGEAVTSGGTVSDGVNAEDIAKAFASSSSWASTVDATTLWNDYDANEVRADKKYKGRSLFITGRVQSIEKDFLDNTILELSSPSEFMATRAYFNERLRERMRDKAAQLSKGDEIRLFCMVEGKTMGSPVLRGCVIQ
jgi:hypothetical protein